MALTQQDIEFIKSNMDQPFEATTRHVDRCMIGSFETVISVGGIVVALITFCNP